MEALKLLFRKVFPTGIRWEEVRERLLTAIEAERVARQKELEEAHKAGYDKALGQLADMTEECKQMGRQEVVEWYEAHLEYVADVAGEPAINHYAIAIHKRQAKLKEWGIKDAD